MTKRHLVHSILVVVILYDYPHFQLGKATYIYNINVPEYNVFNHKHMFIIPFIEDF